MAFEFELAAQDQVIEELEGKLEAEKKKNEDLNSFAFSGISVAVTILAVLACVYDL